MRQLSDAARVRSVMEALGAAARAPGRAYLTGGSSAVLLGWRPTTIDIDLRFEPDQDSVLRAIPSLKESLDVNIELASPGDFIPELPGWRDRSPFIARQGRLDFLHYDFYAQALAKVERGHERDRGDVEAMLARGLVRPDRLAALFIQVEPELFRYPAIDPRRFRRAVDEVLRSQR
jgi:hypothetical protein